MSVGTASSQRGAVLIMSLVLLVGITLVSVSSIDMGLLELVMSGNEEERMKAFQSAQAGVDAITSDELNFPVAGLAGETNCTATRSGETCTKTSLSLPGEFDTGKHWATIERLHPVFGCPPRAFGTSCDVFRVAHFAVDSRFTNVAARGGRSQVLEGFMVVVPQSGEDAVIRSSDISP
jgi:hypothetical protein